MYFSIGISKPFLRCMEFIIGLRYHKERIHYIYYAQFQTTFIYFPSVENSFAYFAGEIFFENRPK